MKNTQQTSLSTLFIRIHYNFLGRKLVHLGHLDSDAEYSRLILDSGFGDSTQVCEYLITMLQTIKQTFLWKHANPPSLHHYHTSSGVIVSDRGGGQGSWRQQKEEMDERWDVFVSDFIKTSSVTSVALNPAGCHLQNLIWILHEESEGKVTQSVWCCLIYFIRELQFSYTIWLLNIYFWIHVFLSSVKDKNIVWTLQANTTSVFETVYRDNNYSLKHTIFNLEIFWLGFLSLSQQLGQIAVEHVFL